MKLDGTYTFNAPRQAVWDVLQDPETLRATIPGVESFEAIGPDEYRATMRVGLGPIKGTYTGKIRVFDQQAPAHYKLSVDAQGGPGVVRGEGTFDLVEAGPDTTTLNWVADGQVGGTAAAVGQRMIVPAAKMMVNQFWKAMDDQVKARQGA
jgi:carbon monoxide dehydrogenase subunit G